MNACKTIIFLLFIPLFAWSQEAQKIEDLKNWQLRDVFKKAELAKDYYTAIDALEELDDRKLLDKSEEISLATLYYKARDNAKALEWFEYLRQEYPKDAEVYYLFAESLRSMGYAASALEYLERFNRDFDKSAEGYKDIYPKVKNAIAACEMAINARDNPNVMVYRQPSDINLPHNETAPFYINDDSLLFASTITNNYRFDEDKSVPKKELVLARRKNDSLFTYQSDLPSFQSQESNFDNPFYYAKENRLYFNQCQYTGLKYTCRLYYTALDSGKIGPIERSPFDRNFNQEWSVKQVSLFERNGETHMIFVSDLPGGEGGLDLWYISASKPTKIINLGKNINTEKDEETPWYDVNRSQLFFSSNGHPGIGGSDIFRSVGFGKKWSRPENLGLPYNSPYDDTYYSHRYEDDSLSFGFFTSNRPGGTSVKSETCCDDIFYFNLLDANETKVGGNVAFQSLIQGEIVQSQGPAFVRLFRLDGEDEIFVEETQTDSSGRYAFAVEVGKKYSIEAAKEGFLSKKITDSIASQNQVIQDFVLSELSKEPIVIQNIYYPFDESYLTDNAKTVIDTTIYEILMDNPQIIVEISSHTDNLGSDRYNERLSQARAESVVQYLLERGINPDRLEAKGYGEAKPIAPNKTPEGRDDPDGRQKNRRTEFRILGVLPQYEDVFYRE